MKVQPSIYRPTPLHAFQHHHRRHPTNPSDWQMWIPHSTVFRKYICWSGEIHLPEANSLATPTCICHHSKATIGSNLVRFPNWLENSLGLGTWPGATYPNVKVVIFRFFTQPLDALSQELWGMFWVRAKSVRWDVGVWGGREPKVPKGASECFEEVEEGSAESNFAWYWKVDAYCRFCLELILNTV